MTGTGAVRAKPANMAHQPKRSPAFPHRKGASGEAARLLHRHAMGTSLGRSMMCHTYKGPLVSRRRLTAGQTESEEPEGRVRHQEQYDPSACRHRSAS